MDAFLNFLTAALARSCGSLLLLYAPLAVAQDVATMLAQKADSLVQEEMRKQNIAGLSLTIVVDKKIAVSRAYGLADLENQVPVTTSTLFRTGSIAKPMTATAAMALYQAGKLDLDAPVQKYCPAFPQKPWTITTRELLGHLSGIRHYRQDNSDVFSTKHYAHVSDAFEMFANDPLLFEPGTKMEYTTFGYDVVGCVVEGASGEDFVTALNALVLTPAGMTSTRTDDAFAIIPHRSAPLQRCPRPQHRERALRGHQQQDSRRRPDLHRPRPGALRHRTGKRPPSQFDNYRIDVDLAEDLRWQSDRLRLRMGSP